MNLIETNGYLTWLSQSDSRIKVTDPNVQIWADALNNATPAEVRQATLDHYRTNETTATPAGIRKVCNANRERAAALQSALTAGPVVKNPNTFRARNPELWDHLQAQGAAKRQNDLRNKGLLK